MKSNGCGAPWRSRVQIPPLALFFLNNITPTIKKKKDHLKHKPLFVLKTHRPNITSSQEELVKNDEERWLENASVKKTSKNDDTKKKEPISEDHDKNYHFSSKKEHTKNTFSDANE